MPKVSVITLFYNRRDLVGSYLQQWRKRRADESVELIFGDSGSTDGSAELVAGAADIAAVRLFPSNLGYARGNNELAKQAQGDVLVFLNYDVQLVPGWLDPMLDALAGWPELGVAGNVQLSVRSREVDHAGMFFDSEGRPFHFRPPLVALENLPLLPVPAVTGACLAVRAELFTRLGGFDESYRNGYEDVDLCLRARAGGAEIAVATKSIIWHYLCSSPGRHAQEESNALLFESRWRDAARSLSRFQPPNLTIPASRAADHPAFASCQTLQAFFPQAHEYSEERSSVHLYPRGRWARIEIPLPRSFEPSADPLRLDPGWEPGAVAVGGLALRSMPQRELVWQVHGARLAEVCAPAGTCRARPARRGLVFESTGDDPQLLIRLPAEILHPNRDWSLEVWLRGEGGPAIAVDAGKLRRETDRPEDPTPERTLSVRDIGRDCRPKNAGTDAIRVLIDLTPLTAGGEVGGIKPALFGMFRWLAAHGEPRLEFVYAATASAAPEVVPLLRPQDRLVTGEAFPQDMAARELCSVVYCPFGMTDLACPGIPTVTLIVDLLHRDFPGSLGEPDRIFRETCLTRACQRTDWFHVISNYTAARLVQHFGIPASQILRAYLPVHDRLPSAAPEPPVSFPPTPFFIYPANAWIHKNHETLLVAYVLYRQIVGVGAWSLVLTGHDGVLMARVRALSRALRLDDWVQFAGYVSEQCLAALWQSAAALVFPSLHEGFGIPLLEAMAHGVPIVAANSTAIPEVVGQAALLVDARDPLKLAEAMAQVTQDGRLRAALIERGRRRVADFRPDVEFERLRRLFVSASRAEARWRRKGYHEIDGLTDSTAIFALPPILDPLTLCVELRPLPKARTLQLWCGPDLVGELHAAAFTKESGRFQFVPRCRTLTLNVPGADRLCETDPRTHGVLLENLRVETPDGESRDLLSRA